MVGTKCDLKEPNNEQHIINEQRAIKQAKEWNIPYIETSAKDKVNGHFLFEIAFYEYWIQSTCH